MDNLGKIKFTMKEKIIFPPLNKGKQLRLNVVKSFISQPKKVK